jgi:hypothetical protein
MLAIGSGRALTWRTTTGAMTENWTQSQLLTGLANLTNMAWRPDGTQILAPSVSSGTVQVIGYSAGLLSLLQSVTVSGAFSIAVNADSTHALVSRSGQSSAMPLTFGGGTWTTGAAVTGLPGITSLASFGDTGVAAAVSGGISFLGLVAGVWNILSTTALGFTPNQVTVDPFLNVYAAGSGALSVLTSGGTVIGSGAWAGAAPTAMAVQNGRVVLAIPSDGLIRLFGQSDTNAWVQKGTAVLAMGTPVGLGLSNTVLFVNGSGSTLTYSFSGAPYTLNRVTSGMASRWNGAAWTDTPLGIGHNPSALNYDASGNAVVVTHQDTLWTIGSGGVVLSSGALTVFPGQLQTTPIGASAVLTASGRTYVGSSLAGVLTEVA